MSLNPIPCQDPAPRIDHALREVYPRLLMHADRLIRTRRLKGLEACDVSQDGILAAVLHLRALPAERLAALPAASLRAILFSVAARAAHGRIVDFLRWTDRRRRQSMLEPPEPAADEALQRGREARETLLALLQQAAGPERRALTIILEMGEVDMAAIAQRSGVSLSHAYRLVHSVACRAGALD